MASAAALLLGEDGASKAVGEASTQEFLWDMPEQESSHVKAAGRDIDNWSVLHAALTAVLHAASVPPALSRHVQSYAYPR